MKKRIVAGIIASCMIVAFSGCGAAKVEEKETDTVAGINVRVSEAFVGDIETTATYTGSLIASDMAYVTSKVSAKIKSIDVELGDWVEEGDVLMILDSSDYEYQLRQAQASYNQAQAGWNSASTALSNVDGMNEQSKIQLEQALGSAKLNYDNAKENFERQTKLYEMGAISLVSYEGAKTAFENAKLAYESAQKNYDVVTNVITKGNVTSAQSGVETAEAAMNAASVAMSMARENIAATRITAPISGYVSAKNVALGQFAAAGSPLFTIVNGDDLEAEINVTEAVIPFVKKGGKANVRIGSANIETEGEVSLVNPVKDAMTGMYTVRVSVPNDEGTLKIGMFADITLYTEERAESAVCVPSDAIMQDDTGYYVFVAESDKAVRRNVVIGVSDGEYTHIQEGVDEGDKVICDGKEYITETNNDINIVE